MKEQTPQISFVNRHAGWFVLVLGLTVTAAATLIMRSNVEKVAKQNFMTHCEEIHQAIINRLDDHARILLSGAALFNATDAVTREQWRIFNKQQKVEKQLPGIQGIGFSRLIPRAELPKHIADIRSEGFPDYKVRPDGERDIYSSIIYLEPFTDRNLRAFGYDMFSEPVRRKAMEQARDTDDAALSGKVVLVQETDKEVQAGTLMYIPVYRKGMSTDTVDARRAAIYGWVYSPYRMNDLMRGMLGGLNFQKEKRHHLQVFDGENLSTESLLYQCHDAGDKKLFPNVRFTQQVPVDFNGQRWTLRFTQTGGGLLTVEYLGAWLTLLGGLLVTFLLFLLINSLGTIAEVSGKKTAEIEAAFKELKRTQDMLVQSEKMAALGMLSAGVAHELNNPLTGILGFARHYIEQKGPDSRETRDLKQVVDAGERMAKIINSLLSFSRPSTGDREELNCNLLIDAVLGFSEKTLIGRDVELQRNFGSNLPLVKADKNRIEQVLIILIGNAIDAMQNKGVLKIATGVRLVLENHWVEIKITDNGCGIKKDDLAMIFDPFFTTKRPGKGTGLGLSVAFSIIKEHNGEILVESPPAGQEQGATFTVRLPAITGV